MRTDYCGLVTEALLGQTVTLCGWVHRRRDHGGVIFIDLRDREGLVQVVCDPDRADDVRDRRSACATSSACRSPAWCARARRARSTPNLASRRGRGARATSSRCSTPRRTPPFQLDDENLSETMRLEHRVLDLRRAADAEATCACATASAMAVRKFLDAHGFIDIETPMLTSRTPEGARDYLVPVARARTASSSRCRSRRSSSSSC